MSLPVGVNTCTLNFGQAVQFNGVPQKMAVVVKPTHSLVWEATGTPLVNFPMTFKSDPTTGLGQVVVPTCDQTGFADEAGDDFLLWSYIVEITYIGVDDGKKLVVRKAVQPLVGDAVIDVDNIPAGSVAPSQSVVSPRPPTLIPYVLTVPGVLHTGAGEARLPLAQNVRVHSVRMNVVEAPTGDDLVLDINANNSSLFPVVKPTVTDGALTAVLTPATTVDIPAGVDLTLDIDQIGSTYPGRQLGVFLYVYQP